MFVWRADLFVGVGGDGRVLLTEAEAREWLVDLLLLNDPIVQVYWSRTEKGWLHLWITYVQSGQQVMALSTAGSVVEVVEKARARLAELGIVVGGGEASVDAGF